MNFIVSCYVLFIFFHYTNANCYFPGELQGVWATQAAPDVTDAPIGYSMVTIEADEISTWGKCHTKVDNNLILAGHRPSGNGIACFRCFRLVVASVNVVALVSGGLESCYSSLQDALHSCPTTERGAAHIVLYKVRSSAGGTGVQETQCPFSGIFYFTYSQGDKRAGDRGKIECEQPTSELSNCPFGFRLSLEYRDCTFKDPRAADWHCLGSWEGLGGQKYIAVLDTYAKEGGTKPKYKCGIYKEDRNDGKVFLAFSRDSTCTNDLLNAENGYERYILYGASTSPLPDSIRDHSCRFPSNLRGQWHNTKIDKSSITYKDEKTFDTYHLQCVHAIGDSERYAIFSRTDCGKWFYNCIMIKRRSANIIEIMFGEHRAESYHPDICNKGYFKNSSSWITQAKSNLELPVTCPIVGTYSGELPDSPGYCAQLHSDCDSKDLMRYNIESCQTSNEVYERLLPKHHNRVHIPQQRVPYGRINPILPFDTSVQSHGPIRIYRKKRSNPLHRAITTPMSFMWGAQITTPMPPESPHLNQRNIKNKNIVGGSLNVRATNNGNQNFYNQQQGLQVSGDTGSSVGIKNNPWNSGNQRTNIRQPFINYGNNQGNFYDTRNNGHRPSNDGVNQRNNFGQPNNLNHRPSVINEYSTNLNGHQNNQDSLRNRYPDGSFSTNRETRNFQSNSSPNGDLGPFHPSNTRRNNLNREWRENPNQMDSPIQDGGSFQQSRNHNDFQPNRLPRVRTLPVSQPDTNSVDFWSKNKLQTTDVPTQNLIPLAFWSDITDQTTPIPQFASSEKTTIRKEEREYQCIGQWEEDGYMYALTLRRDIHRYECFVGIIERKGVVLMKEAGGSSCKRGIQPHDFGMKVLVKAECAERKRPTLQNDAAVNDRNSRRPRTQWASSATRPWKPITGRPKRRRNSSASLKQDKLTLLGSVLLLFLVCRL